MTLHRRELFLVGAGLVAAKATATTVACAKDNPMEQPPQAATPTKAPTKDPAPAHPDHAAAPAEFANAEFAAATADCVEHGEACLQHCITLLSQKDVSMAECAASVHQMLAVCRAMGTLALSHSKHLKAAAELCISVCTDCAAACKPHIDHHPTCKSCHDACQASIQEGKKILA